ncbi:MAG: hypothetical protein AMJ43_06255 [Coxiella sp. DG_40]|nr:MAG: hypothetical protein AMJ43_06255 [Coxiella sp. DG_40]
MNQTKRSILIEYTSKYKEILHSLILEHVKDTSPCSFLDRFIDNLPWGIHLKHNFIMEAMKLPKK